jgi:alpha-beta hydrolase superfamily lysophospholipase
MGGLIGVNLLLRRQQDFAGAVLSGPALSFGANQPGWMKAMAGVIAALLPLREITGLGRGAAESVLSRDPEIQAKFNADPLCWNGGVRARMGYQLLRGAALFGDSDSKLTLPLLLMVGEADTIVDPVRNKLLFDRATSADKTFRAWPGARHEIYNELDKADTIAVTLDWLDNHTQA